MNLRYRQSGGVQHDTNAQGTALPTEGRTTMIQHAIEIEIPRHDPTVREEQLTEAVDQMRRWITDALHEHYGTGGHLSYRWELSLRTVGGNTMLRAWAPGQKIPSGARTVTLIGQGFAHPTNTPTE